MTRKTLLTLAVLTAFSAGTAFAATQAPVEGASPAPRAKLDTNGDGSIDRKEAAAHPRLAGKFDELDKNKDGRISRTEAAAGQAKSAERFDRMDVNKDGFLDRADRELRARQRTDAWFATTDTDKDGKLSRAEVDAAKAKRTERGMRTPAPKPGT